MKSLQERITHWGGTLHPVAILALIIGLNAFWVQTLNAFSTLFMQVSGGLPVLDLQNMSGVLTASEASKLILGYNAEARSLYWLFFILDNIMPLLTFGTFSLLWVNILRRHNITFIKNLRNSAFILIPLGVGLFDILENVFFVTAISAAPGTDVINTLGAGLVFVQLKAFCLFSTFFITMILIVFQIVATMWRLVSRRSATPRRQDA